MAQVARAHTEAFGGPESLAALSVQFRGLGLPENELVVRGTVTEVGDDGVHTKAEATQDGTRIIRNALGEIRRQ
jgi:hypothetical protein